jgi:long-chain acyl-CoA synthetase
MGLVALGLRRANAPRCSPTPTANGSTPTWAFSGAGGVSNGIYPTDAPAQVEYLCADSRTVYLFVEDDEQLDKALEVRAGCRVCARSSCSDMDGLRDFSDPQVISLRRAARDRPQH